MAINFKKKTLYLFVIGLASSITGYFREFSLAYVFGSNQITDAYFISTTISSVFVDLLIGGALTVAVIPSLTKIGREVTSDATQKLFLSFLIFVMLSSFLICFLISFFRYEIIGYFAANFSIANIELVAKMLTYFIALVPLNSFILLSSLFLMGLKSFVKPAIVSVCINITFMLVVMLMNPRLESIIFASLMGPIIMAFISAYWVYEKGIFKFTEPDLMAPAMRLAGRLAKPMILTLGLGSGLGLLMISHLLLRKQATFLGDGAVSSLGYAFRIYEVPITLLTATAGVMVMPYVSSLHNKSENIKIAKLSKDFLFWCLIISIPISILFYNFSQTIVKTFFEYGNFNLKDTKLTSEALSGFSFAIAAEAIFIIFFRVLYSIHSTISSVFSGVVSILFLIFLIHQSNFNQSLYFLALTLSFSFICAAFLSGFFISKNLKIYIFPKANEIFLIFIMTFSFLFGLSLFNQIFQSNDTGVAILKSILSLIIYFTLLRILSPLRFKELKNLINW